MRSILPVHPVAVVVSCHLERPLDDDPWRRCVELARARPGAFDVLWLMRPPHEGEDRELWLERAREISRLGKLGHHTHWTSPTHARPMGGDPAKRVREEAEWLRANGLAPGYFCGGAWYMDEQVAEALAELGYVDCTARGAEEAVVRLPSGAELGELTTTHTVGRLARAVLRPRLPRYVHAYFHDYDLLDTRRRLALVASLRILRARGGRSLDAFDASAMPFSEAFAR